MSDERVVQVAWLRQAEQDLRQALDRRRGPKILSPDHQIHAGVGIIDDAGEMVGRRRILPGENRISDILAAAFESLPAFLGPARQMRRSDRARRVQPPTVGDRRAAVRIVRKPAAGARIGAAGVAVRRGQGLGDVRTRAETGIYQALPLQPVKRFGI